MTTTIATGFLVVLTRPDGVTQKKPNYMGVNRIPAYPSKHPEEGQGMDDYVFGGFKDYDTNLIPTFERARELMGRLSHSPRAFEIIMCSADAVPEEQGRSLVGPTHRVVPLGYDVANLHADYWSIVEDFALGPWSREYLPRLNDSGLFVDHQSAVDYLTGYREHDEVDADSPFDIVFVSGIAPSVA
jgi:hypothetical protein